MPTKLQQEYELLAQQFVNDLKREFNGCLDVCHDCGYLYWILFQGFHVRVDLSVSYRPIKIVIGEPDWVNEGHLFLILSMATKFSQEVKKLIFNRECND